MKVVGHVLLAYPKNVSFPFLSVLCHHVSPSCVSIYQAKVGSSRGCVRSDWEEMGAATTFSFHNHTYLNLLACKYKGIILS